MSHTTYMNTKILFQNRKDNGWSHLSIAWNCPLKLMVNYETVKYQNMLRLLLRLSITLDCVFLSFKYQVFISLKRLNSSPFDIASV